MSPTDTAPTEEQVFDQIDSRLADRDSDGLAALFDRLTPSDGLRVLSQVPGDVRDQILAQLPPQTAARFIDEAPSELAIGLVQPLAAARAAQIIGSLDSDVQADLIHDLDKDSARAILDEMAPDDADEVRRMAAYDSNSAGGLMVAESLSFLDSDTVGTVLLKLASGDDDYERYQGHHPYILNSAGIPVGVVSLRRLLTARRSARLSEIMVEPFTVSALATLDELRDLFDRHPFLGMPVVEANGQLVGVVTRTAVDAAFAEQQVSDSRKLQGVVGDELRSMPLFLRSRRRLAWLTANIGLNIIAAGVISAYESTLAAVIAIAVFLPMVSDMSGCSGNQAVAVSMRELSLGLVRPIDAFRVWTKEISVGLINGIVLGILIGIVAWFWKGNPYLGMVIGIALALNTMIAVSIGGVVPLLLKRFDQDPAVASGPLLTTITDMAGFFIVLSLATAFMPLLVK